ncbi:MAG: TrkA family potassium uptake protein [Chlorobi bacterium]|nr:TrkA family potassium uptake protein [Chlorobiota bacterium]
MRLRYAVIGLGSFGRAVAVKLAEEGAEVLAIDKNEERVEEIKDLVATAVVVDATEEKALRALELDQMDGVVVAIGKTFEDLILATVHLLNINVKRLIARAFNQTQRMILEKLGVHEIVSPEEDAGKALAEKLLHPTFKAYIPLPGGYEIVEIEAPPGIVGRYVKDINFIGKYNITPITVKRKNEKGEYIVVGCLSPNFKFQEGDLLIIMGHKDDIQRFLEIME